MCLVVTLIEGTAVATMRLFCVLWVCLPLLLNRGPCPFFEGPVWPAEAGSCSEHDAVVGCVHHFELPINIRSCLINTAPWGAVH